MEQKIFYQSSLPRAGSTLLQNILAQNPLIYATSTSDLIHLVLGAQKGYNYNTPVTVEEMDVWREGFYAFCRKGIKGYIENLTDKPYFIDKSRGWSSYYSLMDKMIPNPKILYMVRDLRGIFASLEKKFRNSPDSTEMFVDDIQMKNLSTFQRVQSFSSSHPLGSALERLNQSILDKTAEKFLFIRYEDFCVNPNYEMERIYNYLNIEYYQHNFEYIPQIIPENDAKHGIFGDHTIFNTLQTPFQDHEEILGKHACNWIYDNFKEYFDIFGYQK
jgi:sulfotransferase